MRLLPEIDRRCFYDEDTEAHRFISSRKNPCLTRTFSSSM